MQKLIIICAHIPHLDPRIEWMADSLSKKYHITIAGFASYHPQKDRSFLKKDPLYTKHPCIIIDNKKMNEHYIVDYFKQMSEPLFQKNGYNNLTDFIRKNTDSGKNATLNIKQKIKEIIKIILNRSTAHLFKKAPKDCSGFLLHFAKTFYHINNNTKFNLQHFDKILCADLDTLMIGAVAQAKHHIPLIYDAHEIYWASKINSSKNFKHLMEKYEQLLIPYIDKFITVSPPISEYYKKNNPSFEKTILSIPNAAPNIVSQAPKKLTNSKPVVFLIQGVICQERGIDVFIKAWVKAIPHNSQLIIRGPCSTSYKAKLRLLAGKQWNKSIFYKTPIPESKLIHAASQGDVGIIPYPPTKLNQKYCSPNKLGQYMQAGCALLAANSEFVQSIVLASNSGLIYIYNDINDIAKKIKLLAENKMALQKYKENSYHYGKTTFNWQNYEKLLLDFVS